MLLASYYGSCTVRSRPLTLQCVKFGHLQLFVYKTLDEETIGRHAMHRNLKGPRELQRFDFLEIWRVHLEKQSWA